MKKNRHDEMLTVIEAGITKTLLTEYNPPPTEDFIKNFINGRKVLAPLNGLKVAKWLFDTAFMLEDPSKSQGDRFFVLINGLIDSKELIKFFKSCASNLERISTNPEAYEKYYEGGVKQLKLDEVQPKFLNAISIIERIQNSFSEEDIILIKFLRHQYCHPTLDSYFPKISGSNSKWSFDDANYKLITQALEITNSDSKSYKSEIGQRLKPFISDLKSLGQICEDLTYRFDKYDHELFEKWFRE